MSKRYLGATVEDHKYMADLMAKIQGDQGTLFNFAVQRFPQSHPISKAMSDLGKRFSTLQSVLENEYFKSHPHVPDDPIYYGRSVSHCFPDLRSWWTSAQAKTLSGIDQLELEQLAGQGVIESAETDRGKRYNPQDIIAYQKA
ncbi:MAG: hypothetical protein AAGI37_18150 [Planctomycetota bacterium]